MPIDVKVEMEPQGVIDVQNLIRKFKRFAHKGRIPTGFIKTIFWFVEQVYEETFDSQGRGQWPPSTRFLAGLGGPTLQASGRLKKSLGHNPGSLGIRDFRNIQFGSRVPYGGNFASGYPWTPTDNLTFDVSKKRYVPVSLKARRPILYRKGKNYQVPPRRLFMPLAGDSDRLKRLLVVWLTRYSQKGMRPEFRVIEGG